MKFGVEWKLGFAQPSISTSPRKIVGNPFPGNFIQSYIAKHAARRWMKAGLRPAFNHHLARKDRWKSFSWQFHSTIYSQTKFWGFGLITPYLQTLWVKLFHTRDLLDLPYIFAEDNNLLGATWFFLLHWLSKIRYFSICDGISDVTPMHVGY